MKWCMVWVSLLACTALAQEQAVRYTFSPGTWYVYNYVQDQNDVQNEAASENSFVHVIELKVDVENVDGQGNATLFCTVTRQGYGPRDSIAGDRVTREMPGVSGTVTSQSADGMPVRNAAQYHATYADVTPKFRVRLSPRGELLEGEILEKSESQKSFESRSVPPGTVYSRSWSVSDEKRLALTINKIFPVLPDAADRTEGAAWRDSVYDSGENSTAGGRMPGRLPGASLKRNEYSLDHAMYRDTIPCKRFEVRTEKKEGLASAGSSATLLMSITTRTEMQYRFSDGVFLGYTEKSTIERFLRNPEDESATSMGSGSSSVKVMLLSKSEHP